MKNNLPAKVVITTINKPNKVIDDFSKFNNYEVIVVGDKKTPPNWSHENVTYLPFELHGEIAKNINQILPFNHYSRKMIGYVYAIENKAEILIDTDDDNYPNENWGFPSNNEKFEQLEEGLGFINIYKLFTEQKIWPRGLPLKYINSDYNLIQSMNNRMINVGVWQGLADGDPDVDAIYRLVSDLSCIFNKRKPIVLNKGTITPFNSQNTLFIKELFPLLYLPAFVTFRFTDILRGLVAQPIMWLYNFHLGFMSATVTQLRNEHDYFEDFKSEIPMYLHSENVIEVVSSAIKSGITIEENLLKAYEALFNANIVAKEEIYSLEAWLKDIS